ncbi:MAG: hypothetical protein M3X11_15490 [Acidobacteriota bacterium]|nr:hypothetical protein [Acidobacteriota bacterium]
MSQQTSKKTGVASSSEKQANTRHGTQPMPATEPTPGAFGKEPHENPEGRSAPRHSRGKTLKQGDDQIGEESGEEDA